jgi:4-hydroxy-tetrahydrodipicolinate reductase
MDIGLIGFGKMGKEIAGVAQSRGHVVSRIVGRSAPLHTLIGNVQIAIEFTEPSAAWGNILWCMENQIPVVVGTTGWHQHIDHMHQLCKEYGGAVFYASNFSIGVNVVFAMNRILARIMSSTDGYTAHLEEIHHVHKKDSPSGTAISLAQGILECHSGYDTWEGLSGQAPTPRVLPILSQRVNEVPGTHRVIYDSDIDTIALSHEAKSRRGFALGSVLAAEFLLGKTGVYSMNDLLQLNTQ